MTYNKNAEKLWEFLNKNNFSLSFNGIITKGELAINPHYKREDVQVNIYATNVSYKDNIAFLTKDKKLDIKIKKKLLSSEYITMSAYK